MSNYRIVDVRQIPNEHEETWHGVAEILSCDPWNNEDVGAYLVGFDDNTEDEQHQLTFYLNADNRDLQDAERRISERRSETSVDSVRQYHRTLLCYYLYQMALDEIGRNSIGRANYNSDANQQQPQEVFRDYQNYRPELIRLNRTLLYAQREFYESLMATVPVDEE